MKKKLLSLLLVAVMALSLVACGGNKEEESGNAEVKDTFTYSLRLPIPQMGLVP